MKGKQEGEMGEFVEEMAESIIEMDESKRGPETREGPARRRIYYLVFGAAILAGTAVAAVGLLGRKSGPPEPELRAVLSRVQQLEEGLSRAQGLDGRVASLEKEIKQVRQALGEAEKFALVIKQQLDKSVEEMRGIASAAKKEAAEPLKATEPSEAKAVRQNITPPSPQKRERPAEKKEASAGEEKAAALPQGPQVSGAGQYHEVKKGETLYRISLKYGLSVEELCRINGITPATAIVPGKKLKVKP